MPEELPPLRAQLLAVNELAAAGELAQAELRGQAVLAAARQLAAQDMVARTLRQLARIAVLRGDYLRSEQLLTEALGIAEVLGDHAVACMCHYNFARQLQVRGRLREAEAALGEALMYARHSPDRAFIGLVYLQFAVCKQWLGVLDDAFSYAQEALQLFRETGDYDSLFFILTLAADLAHHQGDTAAAEAWLAEAAAMDTASGYANIMCGSYAEAAMRWLAAGDSALARSYLQRADALFDGRSDFDTRVLLHLARGVLSDAAGDCAAGEAEYRLAQRAAQQHQSRCHIALVRLSRAPGLIRLGDLERAQSALFDAELAFELFGSQINLGRTFCAWVHYSLATGSRGEAQAALAKAEAVARRVGPHSGLLLAADLAAAQAALR
jgi:LuxR family maltose regulon positive regulatory protein